jgi:hypothetical protein
MEKKTNIRPEKSGLLRSDSRRSLLITPWGTEQLLWNDSERNSPHMVGRAVLQLVLVLPDNPFHVLRSLLLQTVR